MKRRLAVLLTVLLVLSLAACSKEKDEFKDHNLQNCKQLKNDYNADVYILNADGVSLIEEFEYTGISQGDISKINKKANAGYGCVIIINREGNISLSETEVTKLKRFSEENHYDIFYYGVIDNAVFVKCKLIKEFYDSDCGFFYIVSNKDIGEYNAAGNPNAAHGLWTKQEESLLAENVGFLQYKMLNDLVYFAQKAEKYVTGE